MSSSVTSQSLLVNRMTYKLSTANTMAYIILSPVCAKNSYLSFSPSTIINAIAIITISMLKRKILKNPGLGAVSNARMLDLMLSRRVLMFCSAPCCAWSTCPQCVQMWLTSGYGAPQSGHCWMFCCSSAVCWFSCWMIFAASPDTFMTWRLPSFSRAEPQ